LRASTKVPGMTTTVSVPIPLAAEERVLLRGADWHLYESVLEQIGERRVFVTFDGESLEIMSPSPEHDGASEALGRIVHIVTEESRTPVRSLGTTTLRKQALSQGLEPDKCFYLKNEPSIRGKKRLDLSRVPPPDLAIEVEITRRLLDRKAISAQLGVPELWTYDGKRTTILALSRGKYVPRDRSVSLPLLTPRTLDKLLALFEPEVDETTWALSVRAWVRGHVSGD